MRIKNIISKTGFFNVEFECEYCKATETKQTTLGYYFCNYIMPKMICQKCNKKTGYENEV